VYPGWDGIGFRHPDAGCVCAIYPREQDQEVRLLFEHGVRLEDREGLLEGAGSQTRFLRVRERDDPLAAASVGTCMTRWQSGCFDGSDPAGRVPGTPVTDRTSGDALRGWGGRRLGRSAGTG
jgi:hypothetical protein